MKKLIMFFGAMCLFAMSTFAQVVQEVPVAVTKAFEGKYSNVEELEWDQEDDGSWEVEFVMNNQDFSASFTNEGVWVETEQSLTVETLPASVTTALESEMMGYEIDDVEIVETPKGKFYRLAVDVDGKEYKVKVGMDGKVMEKKMRSERTDGLK